MSELDDILAEDDDDDFVIDFSGTKDKDFGPIPPDTYNVVVEKAERGTSKVGTPKIVLTFKITDGDLEGRKVFMHPVLAGAGLWKTRKVLKALGQAPEGDKIKVSPARLVGQEARGVVDAESSEFSSIADLLPPSRSGGLEV